MFLLPFLQLQLLLPTPFHLAPPPRPLSVSPPTSFLPLTLFLCLLPSLLPSLVTLPLTLLPIDSRYSRFHCVCRLLASLQAPYLFHYFSLTPSFYLFGGPSLSRLGSLAAWTAKKQPDFKLVIIIFGFAESTQQERPMAAVETSTSGSGSASDH